MVRAENTGDLSRRNLLSAGSAITVSATAMSSLRAHAAPRSGAKTPWIPSDEFMRELPSLMKLVALPGLSVAVVEAGSVVWTHALGTANATTGEPVTTASSFEAASMSKPVFAYVVMRLVDEKLIDLDVPLVRYRRPDYLGDSPDLELITVRDVLRHSTGLPNWRKTPAERLSPAFKPGTRFRYSGEGFFWLQLVVEKLTGKALDEVVRSRLFEPAGMPLSTFAWNDDQERRSVYGHTGPGDDQGKIPFQLNRELGRILLPLARRWNKPMSSWTYEDVVKAIPDARVLPAIKDWPKDAANAPIDYFKLPVNVIPNAAASLRTTASEYARFMSLMFDYAKRQSWEISDSSRRAMLSPQLDVEKSSIFFRGLGWALDRHIPGLTIFGHGGNNAQVFRTFGVGDATARRAIVIFTNGGGGNDIFPRIVRAATGIDVLDIAI